jgi:pimeloyl-ACP methyl ester carboxylesterase
MKLEVAIGKFMLVQAFFGFTIAVISTGDGGQSHLYNRMVKENSLEWMPCESVYCSSLEVPMDYTDQSSKTILIQLKKHLAKRQPAQKTIIYNPGGPGIGPLKKFHLMADYISSVFDYRVDVISFDPRGVESSQGISCLSPEQSNEYGDGFLLFGSPILPNNPTLSQVKYYDSLFKLHAELCKDNAGELLFHMSTENVSRDLELIRIAAGIDKLNFWGFSYGSVLGIMYANMFPESVGNFILDGVGNINDYFGSVDLYY